MLVSMMLILTKILTIIIYTTLTKNTVLFLKHLISCNLSIVIVIRPLYHSLPACLSVCRSACLFFFGIVEATSYFKSTHRKRILPWYHFSILPDGISVYVVFLQALSSCAITSSGIVPLCWFGFLVCWFSRSFFLFIINVDLI